LRFLAALQFLTIIPSPRREVKPEDLARSTGYFPVIGLIIGLILVGLSCLFGLFLPSAVTNVLLVVSLVVLSGALHLDGLVDTCDGIGGHKSVEARWRVMDDSRAGAFGIIGVCCLLLIKYVLLNSIPADWLMMALVLMPVLSRWSMVYAIFTYPYAKPSGLGRVFKQRAGWQGLFQATLVALAVAVLAARLAGLAIMVGVWIIVTIMATYLKGKFSGLTGDTYGAINEVAEVSVLLLVLVFSLPGLAFMSEGGLLCPGCFW